MDTFLVGIIGILFLFILLAIGVHISADFFIVGFLGIAVILGIKPAYNFIGQTMYYAIATPHFAALPLFILMGAFAAKGGFAQKAYKFIYVFASKLPGALAIATSLGCAIFGAICGSTIATAAVFGKIALPEMIKYKYDKSFALGTIASAGTFAGMIPPSYGLIVYAIFTEVSIARLFLAGIIPGILTAIVYSLSIIYRVKRNPKLVQESVKENYEFKEKLIAFRDTWSIVLMIIIVLGGIYSGVFTPTEAAAVGSIAALVIGFFQGSLNKFSLVKEAVRDSARSSAMIFIIIIGALFFSRFMAVSQFPDRLAMTLTTGNLPREFILAGICAVWFFLGMIMEGTGIKALLLPIVFPIIVSLGYDPIWFGIVTMKLGEIGCVTPPVGVTVYTLKGVAGEGTTIEEVFKGIWPFVLCDIVVLILMVAFPEIVLFLPNLVMGS